MVVVPPFVFVPKTARPFTAERLGVLLPTTSEAGWFGFTKSASGVVEAVPATVVVATARLPLGSVRKTHESFPATPEVRSSCAAVLDATVSE